MINLIRGKINIDIDFIIISNFFLLGNLLVSLLYNLLFKDDN